MTFLEAQRFSAFDWRKAISAVSYLANETGESLYFVLKMLYLADKAHLDQYGRFISGDWYVAMSKGPVPSETYALLKALRDDERVQNHDAAAAKLRVAKDNALTPIGRDNFDELSDSDIEALDAVIASYRRLGKWAIFEMSHDDVWKTAWESKRFFAKRAPMPMDKIAEYVGGDLLVAHVRDPQPGSV
jgi:uncharacterized phage-associated protein